MRFMLLLVCTDDLAAASGATVDALPDAVAVTAMAHYHRRLHEAGVLIALEGLHPPSVGARVSFATGAPEISDGLREEGALGGYWMIDVASRAQAIAWAARYPAGPGDVIEVRQVQEFADVPPELQRALIGEVGAPDDEVRAASIRRPRLASA